MTRTLSQRPDSLGWNSLGTSFPCECGQTHSIPIEECYVGEDAVKNLARFAAKHYGKRGLVLSDENTWAVGGEAVVRTLADGGKEVIEHRYGAEPMDATEELAKEVATHGAEADFIVAVGAGTLSDLAKYAGHVHDRPVILFPTAASMNGYTSAVVALKIRGLKRTMPCKPAQAIFADPAVVATAPRRMLAAGVGDFLSKCSSTSDWRVSHLLRKVYYCNRPREFFEGAQDELLDAAPRAGLGEPQAVAAILNALLLSGMSMVLAGSSAPASGGEHLISHYLDMKQALYGTRNDLHGAQVGVATIYTLGLWERVMDLRPEDISIDDLLDMAPSEKEVRERIHEDWGPVAAEVEAEWNEKALDRSGLEMELKKVRDNLPLLREAVEEDHLPPDVVAKAIGDAGGPTTPEGLDVPADEYEKAKQYGRYIRSRFTILDLAAELGLT